MEEKEDESQKKINSKGLAKPTYEELFNELDNEYESEMKLNFISKINYQLQFNLQFSSLDILDSEMASLIAANKNQQNSPKKKKILRSATKGAKGKGSKKGKFPCES